MTDRRSYSTSHDGGATLDDLAEFVAAARGRGFPGGTVVRPVRVSLRGKITKLEVTTTETGEADVAAAPL